MAGNTKNNAINNTAFDSDNNKSSITKTVSISHENLFFLDWRIFLYPFYRRIIFIVIFLSISTKFEFLTRLIFFFILNLADNNFLNFYNELYWKKFTSRN